MGKITVLLFALCALMAALAFNAASDGLRDLAFILFAALGALCVISLALNTVSLFDKTPHDWR